jgi:tRNA pseudouridine38-40 synthase
LRLKLIISYDGSKFFGFAYQPNCNTVVSELQKVITKIGIDTKIVASGRTDRGVHATKQIISFDVPDYWNDRLSELKKRLNSKLLPAIYIKHIEAVEKNFHPRFNAISRSYRYIISTGEPNPFLYNYMLFEKDIDFQIINNNIKLFQGIHNFDFFRKNDPSKENFVREIFVTYSYQYRDLIILYFRGSSFVRSQIRLIVSSLIALSRGDITRDNIIEQLECKKKYITKPAPPNGLYFVGSSYN